MDPEHTEVLIAGAGPTGLVLAIDLARRGIPHRLVERSGRTFPGSRGAGIQPRTLEMFDDLGVVDAVLADSGPVLPIQNWDGRRRGEARPLAEPAADSPGTPYRTPRMLPQRRTVDILRTRLEELGGSVEFDTELTGFEQDADGVTATLGTGATVRARHLVATDGGRSTVRKALGVPFHGNDVTTGRAIVADLVLGGPDADAFDTDHWHMWPRAEGGLVTINQLPGATSKQIIAIFDDPGRELDIDRDATPEALGRLLSERTGHRLTVHEIHWASVYRPRVAMAERFRVGHVLLAGDAAHVHPPSGGQGLNTSVQDAYNLGWKLEAVLRRGADDTLLDTYDEERRGIAGGVLGLSQRVFRADRADGGFSVRGPETHQLTLGYRGGALSRETRRGLGPDAGADAAALRAGDRAPDAPLADGALFDAFRGPHFTVLVVGDEAGAVPVPEWVRVCRVPAEGYVKEAYGPGVFVIRPDGYVGLAADDVAGVPDYLRVVGG
ncbi:MULTISPECIES: FAD-dependent monooxygenase [Streptomyces]|uniref:FAD-dependent oxidoreductase n=1 Tax=Streptomyces luteosporeus TaxID=173856 RepID=A0ABN3TK76_9ACTN